MCWPKAYDTSFEGRIEDMWRAYDSGAYLSAIALALTFPDVCSNLATSLGGLKQRTVTERYIAWFDMYVAPQFGGLPDAGHDYENKNENESTAHAKTISNEEPNTIREVRNWFNGASCYMLRCNFLHEGKGDLRSDDKKQDKSDKCAYHVITFRVNGCSSISTTCIGSEPFEENGDAVDHVSLELKDFLEKMANGVREFISEAGSLDKPLAGDKSQEPLLTVFPVQPQS